MKTPLPLITILLFTACGQPKQELAKTPSSIEQPAQTIPEDAPELFGNHEEPTEPWLEAISEQDIKIYLSDLNKNRKNYKEFFQGQLALNGRDTNGNILVDGEKWWDIRGQNGFILTQKNEIVIIEHGKTNYYPVPK